MDSWTAHSSQWRNIFLTYCAIRYGSYWHSSRSQTLNMHKRGEISNKLQVQIATGRFWHYLQGIELAVIDRIWSTDHLPNSTRTNKKTNSRRDVKLQEWIGCDLRYACFSCLTFWRSFTIVCFEHNPLARLSLSARFPGKLPTCERADPPLRYGDSVTQAANCL